MKAPELRIILSENFGVTENIARKKKDDLIEMILDKQEEANAEETSAEATEETAAEASTEESSEEAPAEEKKSKKKPAAKKAEKKEKTPKEKKETKSDRVRAIINEYIDKGKDFTSGDVMKQLEARHNEEIHRSFCITLIKKVKEDREA